MLFPADFPLHCLNSTAITKVCAAEPRVQIQNINREEFSMNMKKRGLVPRRPQGLRSRPAALTNSSRRFCDTTVAPELVIDSAVMWPS